MTQWKNYIRGSFLNLFFFQNVQVSDVVHGLRDFQAFHHNTFIVFLPFYNPAFHLILAHLDYLFTQAIVFYVNLLLN